MFNASNATGCYVVRPNWEGKGYRLYFQDEPDSRCCVQVDGEINGKVYRTIRAAKAACLARFGQTASYESR